MGRDDYLFYRHVTFGSRTKKFGPQQVNYRPIVVSLDQKHIACVEIFIRSSRQFSINDISMLIKQTNGIECITLKRNRRTVLSLAAPVK